MKTESNVMYILRLAATLLIITSLVAAALAGVNGITSPIIAQKTAEKTQLAIQAVLPGGGEEMTDLPAVGFENSAPIVGTADVVTAATPMGNLHAGLLPETSIMASFWGNVGGCIGETSTALLLVGFIYLLLRKVITARIPVAFIGTVAVLTFLFPMGNPAIEWMLYHLFSGGLMLGAIFMATDYVTSPLTKMGQIVYGIGCGALTVLIRYFGGYPEGVSYAILCMNCCVVLLDRIGRPVKFGAPKKEAAK